MRCKHCKSSDHVQCSFIGGKYFVICKSVECAVRPDGTPTVGRPLSDGMDSAQEAWDNYEPHQNDEVS